VTKRIGYILFFLCLFLIPVLVFAQEQVSVETEQNQESGVFLAANGARPPVWSPPKTVFSKKIKPRKRPSEKEKIVYPLIRGRNEFSLNLDSSLFYGHTDRYRAFYTIPATDIDHMGYAVRLGVEGVLQNGFGFRLISGYQRMFYADQGIQQINQSYLELDMVFSYYFKKDVRKFDPYIFIGPTVLFSTSNQLGLLNFGIGMRHFFNDKWSFRIEPAFLTEFDGIRAQLNLGINYHF